MKTVEEKWNAQLYNEKHSFVFNYGESLVDLLDPKEDERILDLGCGAGQLTSIIRSKANEAIGMDKSLEMIESARENFPSVQFLTGDASRFHFDNNFDAIFSNATLHWVTDYKQAIKCMYDNLKPNGRLVAEFGGKGNIQAIENQLRKSLKKRGYAQQAEQQLWYFPSIGEYTSHLEEKGFTVAFAQLYDRPTKLADENTGIKDWIAMFGSSFFREVKKIDIEEIKDEVQEILKPVLFKDGNWYADYKRIRIVAYK